MPRPQFAGGDTLEDSLSHLVGQALDDRFRPRSGHRALDIVGKLIESSEHLVNRCLQESREMKITQVRTVPVWCPRRRAFGGVTRTALGPAAVSDYTIVFVETDAGITGIGEVASVFKRRGTLLRQDLDRGLVPVVIGEDPFRIAYLIQKMDQALDGVEEAKAGIEMALWDIVGKALGTPVYNLLGGKEIGRA